jgi:hypothetical protein
MAGQQGYVNQNIYKILDVDGSEDTSNNTTVTVPMVAAAMATAGNTSGSTYAATTALMIAAEVRAAINQLLANQTAIMQHIAAMNISPPHLLQLLPSTSHQFTVEQSLTRTGTPEAFSTKVGVKHKA